MESLVSWSRAESRESPGQFVAGEFFDRIFGLFQSWLLGNLVDEIGNKEIITSKEVNTANLALAALPSAKGWSNTIIST